MSEAEKVEDELLGLKLTPEEETAAFSAAIEALGDTQAKLAERMVALGDHRSFASILRSIQRMSSGEARVSGEMRVIVELLQRERDRLQRMLDGVVWSENADGSLSAQVEDFAMGLWPQTKGRWLISLEHEDGYRPAWPRWEPSIEHAKIRALRCMEDAQRELDALRRERGETSPSTVAVFQFTMFDITTGDNITSKRMATMPTIRRIGGTPVEGSKRVVPKTSIDDNGMVARPPVPV